VNTDNQITFIGTSHIDPEGYSKLIALLNSLRPDVILVEVSPLSVLLRRTYGHILKLILRCNLKVLNLKINSEIHNVISYLDLPYEYMAVKDYCCGTGSKYILADISFFTFIRFIHAHKLVTRKNLISLSTIHDNRFRQEKTSAGSIFNKKDTVMSDMKLRQFRNDPHAVRRERILLVRLKKYTAKHCGRKIIYVGGWEHLIDDPQHRLLYSACDIPKNRIIAVLRRR
jgi:hypothetical protein